MTTVATNMSSNGGCSNNSSNNTSHMHTTSSMVSMLQQVQAEYRKVQKKTDCETLLVTVPLRFAEAIPCGKMIR